MNQPFSSPPLAWALEWGSVGMLAFALAALVPIALHWRQRPHVQRIPWAATFLLEAALRRTRGQGGLVRKALLATRALAAVTLALALADPRGTSSSSSETNLRPTHIVFLLDDTLSMSAKSGDTKDTARFDQAIAAIRRRLAQARDVDRFSLILVASPAGAIVAEPTRSRDAISQELDRVRPSYGAAEYPLAIDAVGQAITKSSDERIEIVVVSDLQAGDWQGAAAESLAGVARESDARVVLHDVAGATEPANRSLDRLELVDGAPIADSPVAVRVDVAASATAPPGPVVVSWRVDGQPQGETLVDVVPGQTATANWSFVPQGPAWRVVEASLPDDALQGDNRRWLVFRVVPPRLVACVADSPNKATAVVAALASEPGDGSSWRIENVSPSEFARRADEFDGAVFCDVHAFAAGDAAAIRRRIHAGGGAVFLLGRDAPPEHYNRILGSGQGAQRVLPIDLSSEAPEGDFRLDPLDYRHDLVASLAGFDSSGLRSAPTWRYRKATIPAPNDLEVARALDWSSGDPAAVTAMIGAGRTCAMTLDVALDDSVAGKPWSAVPAWPCWPPIAHEAAAWTLRTDPREAHGIAGRELVVPLRAAVASEEQDFVWSPAVFATNESPEAESAVVATTGVRQNWRIPPTPVVGPFVLRNAGQDAIVAMAALNVDPSESRLAAWPVDDRPGAWREGSADAARDASRPRTSWAPWLLVAVLALLAGESAWSSWATAVSHS